MTWHTGPLALFDTETTGVDPHRDRIVTAALIIVEPHRDRLVTSWLLNPGIPIPQEATDVHGITDANVREEGMPAVEGILDIANHLLSTGLPTVGHNISFDLTMLWSELIRHGWDDTAHDLAALRPVIDTMVLDKWADPWRPKEPTKRCPDPAKCGSRRLIDTCRIYGVRLDEKDAHGAEADALAAGRLAWAIANRYPGAQGSAGDVHDWLVGAKREQADSFGAYLLRQGKPDAVSREWPFQSPPAGWTPEQLPQPREQASA